jgi:hypothetical protein
LTELRHLTEEIAAGLQVYVAGRSGSLLKTAFVLCDDYTELTSKMYLVQNVSGWSDLRDPSNPRSFKGYSAVLSDLRSAASNRSADDQSSIVGFHERMQARRARRNVFFHSTTLLDLSVTKRDTVEALVDLLDYGQLLFGNEWRRAVYATPSMEILDALLRADLKSVTDHSVFAKVNATISSMERNRSDRSRKGVHLAVFPEDLHLLLAVRWGGDAFRDKLRRLVE